MGKVFRGLYSFFATVVVIFALVTIGFQLRQIIEKNSLNNAQEQGKAKMVVKPRIFFSITDLVIPVYTADSSFRRVVMDLRVSSYDKHLKAYFGEEENIPLLYDRLNTKLAPIALEFPLEEEGKRIIKDKVLWEINELVKELGIKGQIEEVYIDYILAA